MLTSFQHNRPEKGLGKQCRSRWAYISRVIWLYTVCLFILVFPFNRIFQHPFITQWSLLQFRVEEFTCETWVEKVKSFFKHSQTEALYFGQSLYIRPSFVFVSNNGWSEPLYTSLLCVCEQQWLARAFVYVPQLCLRAATAGLSLYIRPIFVSVSNNVWPKLWYTSLICVCEQQLPAKTLIYVPNLCLWAVTASKSFDIRLPFVSSGNNC